MVLWNTTSSGKFTVTGNLTVGDGGIGTLFVRAGSASTFEMTSGAAFNFQLAGDGTSSDQITFYNYTSGRLSLNDNAVNLSLTGTEASGTYTVSLFTFYNGYGDSVAASALSSGLHIGTLGDGITSASLVYGTNSIDLIYAVEASTIPEPDSAAILLGICASGVVAMRRRRAV